jgi:hypothetical protein
MYTVSFSADTYKSQDMHKPEGLKTWPKKFQEVSKGNNNSKDDLIALKKSSLENKHNNRVRNIYE